MYAEREELDDALAFRPGTLRFTSPNGQFTGVDGRVTAHLVLPKGYRYDGGAMLETELGLQPIPAEKVADSRNRLIATFDKALLDNNLPEGESEVVLVVNATHDGVQRQVAARAEVTVVK